MTMALVHMMKEALAAAAAGGEAEGAIEPVEESEDGGIIG